MKSAHPSLRPSLMVKSMAARFEQKISLQNVVTTNKLKTLQTLITLRRGRERSNFEVLHTRLLLLLVPDAVIHVRFELLRVSSGKIRQALIHPLFNPPQRAVLHLLDGIDDISGLLLDLIMHNLVGGGGVGFALLLIARVGERVIQICRISRPIYSGIRKYRSRPLAWTLHVIFPPPQPNSQIITSALYIPSASIKSLQVSSEPYD
jgi:hypothetical protein